MTVTELVRSPDVLAVTRIVRSPMSNVAGSTFFKSPLLFVQHFSIHRVLLGSPAEPPITRFHPPRPNSQNLMAGGFSNEVKSSTHVSVSVRWRPFESKSVVIVSLEHNFQTKRPSTN